MIRNGLCRIDQFEVRALNHLFRPLDGPIRLSRRRTEEPGLSSEHDLPIDPEIDVVDAARRQLDELLAIEDDETAPTSLLDLGRAAVDQWDGDSAESTY